MSVRPTLGDAVGRLTGLAVDDRRATMLENRLASTMHAFGAVDAADLAMRLIAGDDPKLTAAVVEAVVVAETLFFRDRAVFEQIRTRILPDLVRARAAATRLRIWSAACSTGQEPYSLAMLLDEKARALAGWSVDLVATDLSAAALARARLGRYSHFEVQRGLPTSQLLRHFRKAGSEWEISEALRAAVSFVQRDLRGDLRSLGIFDLICCRNVLMYMDVACRRAILQGFAEMLPPDGVLVLGAAETVVGVTDRFEPLTGAPAVFVKRTAARRAA